MFSENLKTIRKAKGYTQEELAIKVNVVRQTVSKWEKGLSVPDADVLSHIAEVLEVNVSELLGAKMKQEDSKNEVAEQLAKISEQLAIKNRRSKIIWKTLGIVLLVSFILFVIVSAMGICVYSVDPADGRSTITEEGRIQNEEESDKIGVYSIQVMTEEAMPEGFKWREEDSVPGIFN